MGNPHILLQDSDMVPIAVRYEEAELLEKQRKMRARWDPAHKGLDGSLPVRARE